MNVYQKNILCYTKIIRKPIQNKKRIMSIKNKKDRPTRHGLSAVRQGVTLTELVVVIAIIGIMSAVSIVSLTTARRNSELESAAEDVVAILREAQNYSLSGKQLTANCPLYRVGFGAGSSDVFLRQRTASTDCLDSGAINSTYVLKNGVYSASGWYFYFLAPFGTLISPGTIQLSKGGSNYYVCARSSGVIEKSKTAFASCN